MDLVQLHDDVAGFIGVNSNSTSHAGESTIVKRALFIAHKVRKNVAELGTEMKEQEKGRKLKQKVKGK